MITTHRPVARERSRRKARGTELILQAALFLLPVQVALPVDFRLAPTDILVFTYLLMRGPALRHVRGAWTAWHGALLAVVWSGLVVALARTGSVSANALVAKAIGLLVLFALAAALVDAAADWEALRRLLRAFLAGVVLSAAASLAAFALLRFAGVRLPVVNEPYASSRLTGLLIDPNAFGGILATALVLHVLTASSKRPLLIGPTARLADIVLPLVLLLTFSRSAWIGVSLGLLAAALVQPSAAARAARRLAVPAALAFGFALTSQPDFGQLASRADQVQARVDIAGSAIQAYRSDPLLGTGLGVFGREHGVIVHNSALWFLTELGAVGLGVFAAFLVATTVGAMRTMRALNGSDGTLVLAVFAAAAVGVGVSIGIEATYQRYWWLSLAGLGVARVLVNKETVAA